MASCWNLFTVILLWTRLLKAGWCSLSCTFLTMSLPDVIFYISLVLHISDTAISRKVVGRTVHATMPKGNMGYDRYTVPDDCSFRIYFCCFPLALANTFSWPFVPILSNFFFRTRNSKPPSMPFGIVACTFPDNLSRNGCIHL